MLTITLLGTAATMPLPDRALSAAFAACGGNKDDGNTTKTPAVKVIDYDLTSEQYAFGVDKNQPELLTRRRMLTPSQQMTKLGLRHHLTVRDGRILETGQTSTKPESRRGSRLRVIAGQ